MTSGIISGASELLDIRSNDGSRDGGVGPFSLAYDLSSMHPAERMPNWESLALGASAIIIIVALLRVYWNKRRRGTAGALMDFEFGQTTQSEAFFDRNPKFYPAFERLMVLTNKCFGRSFKPKNRTEDICFSLGQTCRQDFLAGC